MTFSLHQGGVVMSSQVQHTQSHQETHLSPYTWQLRLDFHYLRPFYSLSQPHHVMASIPSSCDNHQSMGGQSERTQCQAKMAVLNSSSYTCTRALHTFRSFAHCRAASTIIPLLPNATFTPPSSLTSVSLVPIQHWLQPSTPFWPYGNHPFFPYSQTISILSDLLYLLTPFLFQLSYAPLHS